MSRKLQPRTPLQLTFFSPEPVEKAISHRNNCVTRALTISNNGPLHVIIPPEADYFIDPASF